MASFTEKLSQWLQTRWGHYYNVELLISGGYGLVFILTTSSSNNSPRRFALKTINPASMNKDKRVDVPKMFERELEMWLKIPSHPNVLPALGLVFAHLPPDIARWPLVHMPFCNETLGQWSTRPEITIKGRLIVLTQFCNGLKWIYQHGLEGHGDLKPDNVLLRDLRNDFDVGTGFPWCARVSDLGWSNVWTGLGRKFFQRCHPAYQAPERFDEHFIPIASDIFSVGVIICEVLTGLHPAGKNSVATKKRKEWEQWAKYGERKVSHLPKTLVEIITYCLDPVAKVRPNIDAVIATLVRVLEQDHDIFLSQYLEMISAKARQNQIVGHRSWALRESARLGSESQDKSIIELESLWHPSPVPIIEKDIAEWLYNGGALNELLLKRGNLGDRERVAANVCAMLDYVITNYGSVDLRSETGITDRYSFEVMEYFGVDLILQLDRAKGQNDDDARRYRELLNQVGRFHAEEHLQDWLGGVPLPRKEGA